MNEANPYQAPVAALADPRGVAVGEVKILSARGRLGRLRYIAYATIVTLVTYAMIVAAGVLGGLGAPGALVGGLLMFTVAIASTVMSVLLAIKRLHDFNATGWWVLAFLVPLLNLGLTIALLVVPGAPDLNRFGPPTPPNSLGVIVTAILFPLIIVAAIVAVVAIPGLEGILLSVEVSGGPR